MAAIDHSQSDQKHEGPTIVRWILIDTSGIDWRADGGDLPILGDVQSRSANRAEAAIVTARQFLSVDKGGLSINSDSSSQSCAENLACSGPYNFHKPSAVRPVLPS